MCCVGPTVVRSFVSWYIFILLVRPFFVNVCVFFLLSTFRMVSHVPSLSSAYNATGGSLNIQVSIRARQCFQLFFFFSFLFFSFLFTFSFFVSIHSSAVTVCYGMSFFSPPSDSVDDHRASTGHNSHSQQLHQQLQRQRRWQYVSPDRDVEANVSTRVTKESV